MAVELADEGRQEELRRARETSAHDDEAVDQRDGVGDGVSGDLPQPPEGFAGRRLVAGRLPARNRGDLARLRGGVRGNARSARVGAPHGADADAVLRRPLAVELVAHEPDLSGRAVVADEERRRPARCPRRSPCRV